MLTGTPLQNTVEELFSLLHFLEPARFPSENTFMQEFGDLKTEEQVSMHMLTFYFIDESTYIEIKSQKYTVRSNSVAFSAGTNPLTQQKQTFLTFYLPTTDFVLVFVAASSEEMFRKDYSNIFEVWHSCWKLKYLEHAVFYYIVQVEAISGNLKSLFRVKVPGAVKRYLRDT